MTKCIGFKKKTEKVVVVFPLFFLRRVLWLMHGPKTNRVENHAVVKLIERRQSFFLKGTGAVALFGIASVCDGFSV